MQFQRTLSKDRYFGWIERTRSVTMQKVLRCINGLLIRLNRSFVRKNSVLPASLILFMIFMRVGVVSAATVIHQFEGSAQYEYFGRYISEVGEVDGDGVPDVLIGGSQKTIVYSGADGSEILQLPGVGYGGIDGPGDMGSGNDGPLDGVPDVLIGNGSGYGTVTVYSGADGALIRQFTDPTGSSYGTGFASSVSAIGDVTGDGISEVVAGAPRYYYDVNLGNYLNIGRAYLFNGKTGEVIYTFQGLASNSWFGLAVSGTGDVNGDSIPDIMVAAPYYDNNTGYVDVYSGANGALLKRFSRSRLFTQMGYGLSAVGDLNGDGRDDIAICEPYGRQSVFVYSGANFSPLLQLPGQFYSVAGAGDVDGDGTPDVIAGEEGALYGKGMATVFSGADGSIIVQFAGSVADGKFGQAVSGIAASPGDVDGDGLDDLIIGAPWAEVNGISSAGIAYVYSVAEPPQTGPLLREDGDIYVSSETPNALGNSVSFNPQTKRYAVGYSDYENHQVKTRIVEADGSMPFQANIVSQTPQAYFNAVGANPSSPALEYEFNDNGFIAMWSEDGGGSVRRYDVMAADLGSTAGIWGSKHWVTPRFDETNQSRGFLSLNPNTGAYLATWREESQSRITGQIRDRIFGKFGSGAYDLTSNRPPIQISFPNNGNSDGGGLAAFDDASNTWLVVWTRRNYNLPYNDPGRDTAMGQRMATTGLVGSVISPLPGGISGIIANPNGPGWILVRSEGNEIFATFMNSDGTLGSEFQLTADSEIDSYPSIAALNGYYLVTWNRPTSGTRTIVAQLFDSGFFPLGGIIQVPSFADPSQSQPGVAANPEDEEFLVVWYQGSYDSRKVYAQLLSISPNTPAGQDVTVNLGSGITVTFDEVTVPGTTTITTSTIPPAGNFGIEFISLFYDITTTATFTGNVHIEINYDDSSITPPAQETDLRLFKFPGTPPAPIDITDGSISPNPDTTANMIYGVTDGFSIFAVGILLNQPPVADAGDNDTVPADALCEADVSLDGGGSYDPDGTIEKYTWTGPFGEVLGVNPTVTLGLGENTITLTVSDGELTGTDEVVVTVEDTTPRLSRAPLM